MTWETKIFDVDARITLLRNLAKFTSYKVVICAKTSKGCGKEYSAIAHTWDDGRLQIILQKNQSAKKSNPKFLRSQIFTIPL